MMFWIAITPFLVGFAIFIWPTFDAWGHALLSRERRALRAENKRCRVALKMYADRSNWIGSEFIGTDEPTTPATLALHGEDAAKAIKALPPSRFAERTGER
jgi:hypothetical protein